MNFDPMTGQPINQNNTNFATGIPTNTIKQNSIQTQTSNVNVVQQPQITTFNSQQMIQNIPTVEQTKQEFINNIQTKNQRIADFLFFYKKSLAKALLSDIFYISIIITLLKKIKY